MLSPGHVPIEVFYCYAREDEPLLRELEKHLSLLHRQGLISSWSDRQILPGADWTKTIDHHLETASLILLLISADFLASDYCYGIEMARALQRHEAKEALVIPILLRPVDWQGAPFAHLQVLPSGAIPITSWTLLDTAFTDVVAGIRRSIEELPLLTSSASRNTLPSIWNIPSPHNIFFLGREDLLARLYAQLQADQRTALTQPQAICGLGGIGKTRIAVEYAYRYHQEYQVVLWAHAESLESLTASYSEIATLLKLPERQAGEQEVMIQAVRSWLQTHHQWLLILDNADDLDLLPPFLPIAIKGHLLLTTRAQALGQLANRIEIPTLSLEDGALLLLRRAALLPPDTPFERASLEDRQRALHITEELGGLPLALDQAGAYLEETGCGLDTYQHLYQQHRGVFLQERRSRLQDHPASVATTLTLSFQWVEQRNAAAAELLQLCAYLAPNVVPENILRKGAPHLGSLLKPLATDLFQFNQAIEVLRASSLLSRNPRASTLSVHRLVQVVLRDRMETAADGIWKQRAVRAVSAACPETQDMTQWDAYEQWLPHALMCATWIKQEQVISHAAVCVLHEAGYYLYTRARYTEAEPLLVHALAINEQLLGPDHPGTAQSLHTLALLYRFQGRYAEAESLHRRALTIREQQLGTHHPETAQSLHHLAHVCYNLTKDTEAEPLLLRALAIREQQLGVNHAETAQSLSNLAFLYHNQGKYTEAERLHRRALTIREQILGASHPDTAVGLCNLAVLYLLQRNYTEAKPLLARALRINEQQLGANHPDTITCLDNLAIVYMNSGKGAEAESLHVRALTCAEQLLGKGHPLTAQILNNMANNALLQGDDAKAESLMRRALIIAEQQLGPNHPLSAQSLDNLAMVYIKQGKDAEAEPLLVRALAIKEHILGANHPTIALNLSILGIRYFRQGKYAQAEPLLRRILTIGEQQYSSKHPHTWMIRKGFIGILFV
ncbi:MAG TPA: tetratricopeptide repeat protein, partial [Ktedonobacteraceae bacterium]|nr:tetratricopeptide repeat protein [Ktedonobacteraceae bacterium]